MTEEVKPKEYNLTRSGVYQSIYLLGESVYPEAAVSNGYCTLLI